MNANDYQRQAARTLLDRPDAEYTGDEILLVWNALKLAGEAGEVANLVGKGVFHRHGVDTAKLLEELGDVLWYVAAICTKLDVPMEDVMSLNIVKLRRRYPEGYNSEASQNRAE